MPVDYGQLGRIERGEYAPRPALGAVLAFLLDLDAARDFPRKADREPKTAPPAADRVQEVRDAERAEPQEMPELPGRPVKRAS